MQTDCSTTLFEFAPVEERKVVASFDGGTMTSNAGALLLGSVDKAVRLIERARELLRRPARPEADRAFGRHAGGATDCRPGAGA